jgi:hypothetical protein
VRRREVSSRIKSPLAIAAVLIGAALLISFVAGYSFALTRDEQSGTPEMGPIEAVPSENLPGQDVPGMQRYPGAVRVKYGSHLLGEKRVSEAGYLAEGEVGDAQEFLRTEARAERLGTARVRLGRKRARPAGASGRDGAACRT